MYKQTLVITAGCSMVMVAAAAAAAKVVIIPSFSLDFLLYVVSISLWFMAEIIFGAYIMCANHHNNIEAAPEIDINKCV